MANDVEITVISKDKSGPGLDAARRRVQKLGDDAKITGVEFQDMNESAGHSGATIGDAFRAAAKDTKTFGDAISESARATDEGMHAAKRSVKEVDDAIGKLNDKILGLKERAKDTGSSSFSKEADKLENDVKKLHLFKNALSAIGDTGKTVGHALSEGFSSSLNGVGDMAAKNPYIAAGIAAGILVGAPVIGAAASSAILAGVSGGALAGGIVLAAKDARVSDAWGTFADGAMEKLTSASGVFIEPLISGANKFGSAFDRILPGIEQSFATLAPTVDNLVGGVTGLVENAMPGINNVIQAGAPFLDRLAEEMPNIGNAVSDFMNSIVSGAPGAMQFFGDALVFTEKFIVGLGNTIEFLSKAYKWLDDMGMLGVWGILSDGAKDSADATRKHAEETKNAAEAMKPLASGVQTTTGDLQKLNEMLNSSGDALHKLATDAVNKIVNSLLSADHAVLGFAESQTKLTDAIDKNGLSLDIHTKSGQQNREAILGVVEANLRQYDSNMAAGLSAQEAATAYGVNTAALEQQMRQAGYTQEQIDNLIGKYRGVPNNVNTDISTGRLADAINGIADLVRTINGIPRYVLLTIEEQHRTTYTSDIAPSQWQRGLATGGISGAAGGGPRSNLVRVGEQGEELVRLPFGSTVIPHGQSKQMMNEMSGASGGSAVVTVQQVGSMDPIVQAFMKLIRLEVRTDGVGALGFE